MDAQKVADKVRRTTGILDMMDEETCFRMNRGLVLMETSDRDLAVITEFFTKCRAARLK